MNDLALKIVAGVVFVALVLLSVGLHELGHFIPGKLFKVKVLQFFIGFGKTLWKTRKGETDYGVKLLPLGGYVRLLGMYPPYKEGKDGRLKRIADSAREAEWEDITDADVAAGRLYFQQPRWQRLIIMFSGVATNIVLAFVLFLGVNLAYGQLGASLTIATVYDCVEAAPAPCTQTPAAAMGLKAGDKVVAFNQVEYKTWAAVSAALKANLAGPVQLTVIRDGQRVDLPRVPGVVKTIDDPNHAGQTMEVGFLGVTVAQERQPVGVGGTLAQMWDMTRQSVVAIGKLPVMAVNVVIGIIKGEPRDPNGALSVVGAAVIAGDIAAADAPWSSRLAVYVMLLASINLFVGLLNLVPLPPFDGGHAAADPQGPGRAAVRRR